jgi:hypothetical protein
MEEVVAGSPHQKAIRYVVNGEHVQNVGFFEKSGGSE